MRCGLESIIYLVVFFLVVGMSMGCAGTQEIDEPKEPEAPAVEGNSSNTEEEEPPSETADKTATETQVGPGESASTPSCGDLELAAKYDECNAAKEEQPCVAAGGKWTRVGMSPVSMCQCYTGQEECTCETGADCLSDCIAALDLKDWGCSPQRHCSKVSKTAGCWCRYHPDGNVRKVCMD